MSGCDILKIITELTQQILIGEKFNFANFLEFLLTFRDKLFDRISALAEYTIKLRVYFDQL